VVEETIEEVFSDHDEELDRGDRKSRNSRSSLSNSFRNENSSLQKEKQFSFFSSMRNKRSNRRAYSSICALESETIAEELEEYEFGHPSESDHRHHYFIMPR